MMDNEFMLQKYAIEFDELFEKYVDDHITKTIDVNKNDAEWYDVMVSFIGQETYYKTSQCNEEPWLKALLVFYGTLALFHHRGLIKMRALLILNGLILPALLIDGWEDRS